MGNTTSTRTDLPGARFLVIGRGPVDVVTTVLRNGGDARSSGERSTERAGRGESRGGCWEGETSESFNPRDGFGVKQSREDEGGAKRQEVEKA